MWITLEQPCWRQNLFFTNIYPWWLDRLAFWRVKPQRQWWKWCSRPKLLVWAVVYLGAWCFEDPWLLVCLTSPELPCMLVDHLPHLGSVSSFAVESKNASTSSTPAILLAKVMSEVSEVWFRNQFAVRPSRLRVNIGCVLAYIHPSLPSFT